MTLATATAASAGSVRPPGSTALDRFSYDDDIVRKFLFATVL